MKKLSFLFFTTTILSLTSCKKDKENPVITVNSPENHSDQMLGGTMSVNAIFTDDIELSEYHVHIGDIDGNHVMEFMYEDHSSITGSSHEFTDVINIPDSIGMVYYLHFEVTDTEGKETNERIMLHFM